MSYLFNILNDFKESLSAFNVPLAKITLVQGHSISKHSGRMMGIEIECCCVWRDCPMETMFSGLQQYKVTEAVMKRLNDEWK